MQEEDNKFPRKDTKLGMKHSKKKFVPTFWFFDKSNQTEDNPDGFFCYYAEGIWDKYGLHYTDHIDINCTEEVHLKGKKYCKPPYAYNSYEDMIRQTEKYAKTLEMISNMGNAKKEAVYLLLDLDEDGILRSDPFSIDGYVGKRGTIFYIRDGCYHGGDTKIELTEENRHLVFPDIAKAADYIHKKYGWWACVHYLKGFPGSV